MDLSRTNIPVRMDVWRALQPSIRIIYLECAQCGIPQVRKRDRREIEGILEDRVFAIFNGAVISMDAVDIRLTFDDESWDGKVFV